MSLLKRAIRSIDPSVSAFTSILQKRRGLQIGPSGSVQGFFYRIGVDFAGNSMSPESALSIALKEWCSLQGWPLDTQISIIESRVMGNKYVAPSDITTFETWLAWRLQLAFPRHDVTPAFGWSPEFFKWATSRAKEHFL